MTREREVLLAAVRLALGTGERDALRASAGAGLDWQSVADLARFHGLLPLCVRGLQEAGCAEEAFPDGGQAVLRGNAQRNLRLTAELVALVSALEEAGVTALAYKGPVLAAWAFGDLSLRSFMDLDLLVRESDLPAAHEVALARGYQAIVKQNASLHAPGGGAPRGPERWRDLHRVYWHEERKVLLEVHWGVTPGYFGARLDPEVLFREAVAFPLGGRELLTLCPAHCLLALCIHGSLHRWGRLDWVCSVAEVLRAAEREGAGGVWGQTWELAQRVHARRMLLLGLALARELYAVALPPELQARAEAERALPGLLRAARGRLEASGGPTVGLLADARYRLYYFFASRDRGTDGLGSLLRWLGLLLAPGEADRQWVRLPRGLSFLHVLLRPLRVLAQGPARKR
jgi:hypothetical protein